MGHRNVKLVDTYQQLVFKKQQNGSYKYKYKWKWIAHMMEDCDDLLWIEDPELLRSNAVPENAREPET